jgi:hypothetical protein
MNREYRRKREAELERKLKGNEEVFVITAKELNAVVALELGKMKEELVTNVSGKISLFVKAIVYEALSQELEFSPESILAMDKRIDEIADCIVAGHVTVEDLIKNAQEEFGAFQSIIVKERRTKK